MNEMKTKKTIAAQIEDPAFIAKYEAQIETFKTPKGKQTLPLKEYIQLLFTADADYGIVRALQNPQVFAALEAKRQEGVMNPQAILMEALVPGSSAGQNLGGPVNAPDQQSAHQPQPSWRPENAAAPTERDQEAERSQETTPAARAAQDALEHRERQEAADAAGQAEQAPEEQEGPEDEAGPQEQQETDGQAESGQEETPGAQARDQAGREDQGAGDEQREEGPRQPVEPEEEGVMNLFVNVTGDIQELLDEHKMETTENVGSVLKRLVAGFKEDYQNGSLPEGLRDSYDRYAAEPGELNHRIYTKIPRSHNQALLSFVGDGGNRNALVSALIEQELQPEQEMGMTGMSM